MYGLKICNEYLCKFIRMDTRSTGSISFKGKTGFRDAINVSRNYNSV